MADEFQIQVSDAFGMVPLWLCEAAAAKRVSRDAVALFAFMAAKYAGRDGRCFPSHQRLAEEFGAGEKSVRRWLDELRAVEAVTWDPGRTGKANTYVLWMRPCGSSRSVTKGSVTSDRPVHGGRSPVTDPSVTGDRPGRSPVTAQPEESITRGAADAHRAQAAVGARRSPEEIASSLEGIGILRAAFTGVTHEPEVF